MKRIHFLSAAMLALIATFGVFEALRASAPQIPADTWAVTGDMAAGRAGASGTLLPDGRLLVAGGLSPDGAAATAERYSVESGAFLATPPMQDARANHSATLLLDGRVLVVGGSGADGHALSSSEIYDSAANVWLPAGPLSYPRSGHTATLLPDGRVLIAGGDDAGVATATLEVFDPASGSFTIVDGAMSSPRSGHAAAASGDAVMLIGGFDGSHALASVDVFDSKTGAIAAGPSLAVARAGHSATTLLDGKVLVAGGASDSSELASAEIFDPAVNAFAPAGGSLAVARQHHLAVLLPHNNTVLFLGGAAGGRAVSAAELYIPWESGGSFVAAAAPSQARTWATGGALSFPASDAVRSGPADGLLVLAGGSATADAAGPSKSAELYGFATIRTDKSDYAPGTTVTITGSGWQPGEWVALMLVESPVFDTHPLLAVQADDNGNIVSTEFSPDEHDLNIRFYLTAIGTYSQAQTTFTDSQPGAVVLSPASVSVSAGNSAVWTNGVTVTKTGSSTACDLTLSVSPNPVATGASASFNAPNPVTMTTADVVKTLTITTTNTGPAAGRTPTGTYPFTVTATKAANCQGGTGVVTTTGTLIVFGAATHLAFGQQPTSAVSTTNVSPAITVQVLDANNNVVANSSLSVTLAIANNPGSGTLSGVATQSAVNGVATFGNLSIDKVGTGYTLSASSSLPGATSNPFNITVGPATKVRVETAADGTGTVVPAQTVNSGSSITVFSIRRDAGDNFIDNVALASATDWSLVNLTGGVVASDLNSNGNRKSATFTGNAAGSAAIRAAFAGLASVNSGTLTVVPTIAATTLSAAPASGAYGGTTTVSAALTKSSDSSAVSGKTIAFSLNGTSVGTAITNASGVATLSGVSLVGIGANTYATGVGATFAGDSNFSSSAGSNSLTVNKATPTFTALSAPSITFGAGPTAFSGSLAAGTAVPSGSVSVTVNGVTQAGAINIATGAFSASVATQAFTVSGSPYTITYSYPGDANFNSASDVSKMLTVGKANQATVTVTAPAAVTYGAPGTAAATGGSGTGSFTFSVGTSTGCSVSGTTVTVGDVTGTCVLTAIKAADANFNASSASAPFTVTLNKAAMTVTPDSGQHKTYGGVEPTLTYTHSALVNGDTDSVFSGALARDPGENVSTYAIRLGTLSAGSNYNTVLSATPVTFEITRATAIVVVTAYNVPYDGHSHTATVTSITGVNGETGAAVGTVDVTQTAHTNAGVYNGDPWTFNGGSNYNNANGTVDDNISKINATITVTPYNVPYDGNAHTATATATGIGGATVGAFTLTGTTHTNAGVYTGDPWTFSGGTNYNDASGTIDDNISKIDATIHVTPYSVDYDGHAHTATGTATGLGGVDLSATLNLTGTTHTDAGDYPADAWSFAGGTNYNDANGAVHDHINKINATITVTAYSVDYDGNAHTATGTALGIGGVSVGTLTLTGTTHTDAGDYPADAWTFAGGTNYNDANGAAHDHINKINATINVTPYNVLYDSNAHTATGTATGLAGVDLSGTLNLTGTTHTDAGDYPADAWTFAGGTNYNDASGTVHDHISKIDATVHVTPYNVPYDGNAHTATATATGIGGASVGTFTLTGTTHTNAGVYNGDAWTFSGGQNYNDTSGTVDDNISKINATVTVTSYSVNFDGNAHIATGTALGIGGLSVGTLTLTATTHTDAGDYTADAWTFAGGTNYNDTNGLVHDHIAKINATVTVTPYNVTYDGAAHTATGTATGLGGAAVGALTLSGTTHTSAGDYAADAWSFAGGTNYYDASGIVHDSIGRRPVAASGISANNKPFDGTTAATLNLAGASVVGVLSGDLVVLNTAAATGTFNTPNVGVGKPVTVVGLTIGGASAGNYTLTLPYVTTANITPWSLSGFYQPVTMPGTGGAPIFNSIKGGQTVPLKFNLYQFPGGPELTSMTAIQSMQLIPVGCSNGVPIADVDPTALSNSGGTALRYDGSQFIENWQTPKGAGQCFVVAMTAADGSGLSAYFRTK